MRVNGRLLRPSNLAERRVLKSLGVDYLRCPRNANPYALARRIRRISRGASDDLLFVRDVAAQMKPVLRPTGPSPTPDVDTTEDQAAAHGTG